MVSDQNYRINLNFLEKSYVFNKIRMEILGGAYFLYNPC